MGRLLKKKTTPKKKKPFNEEEIVSQDTNGAQTKPIVTSGNDKKKKQPLPQKKAVSDDKQSDGYINKGMQFLREVKIELKKVTWPTRAQTMGSTAIVIILVMIISFFLGLVDVGLNNLVKIVLH